ncbi:uncharacterized protein Z520_05195 [Fonsecaea multimorphosa CBS 102226]|uniref:Uncharacterized protein n=1 Tax=Fonsecaea multimorphosa CBS 102226 TaxID=1442371 RepID=A0A0D2K6B4_9EURO|nr:uncharacterized protein Z520_05195 [Fonsecaea multimorphosa CBS 102226]KIX98734.1 hypothetical protein Z520_05195 [Fonsecaea multimorphosa CBS 102226]OAL25018.1 hypothetical protein AYO22_04895 [Fonsecaea multimorphosa]
MEDQPEKACQSVPAKDARLSTTEQGVCIDYNVTSVLATNRLQRFANRLDAAVGVEARGIERVDPEARNQKCTLSDYLAVGVMWFSINCTANQLTLGVLGPVAFGLGFVDSVLLCMFGTIFGSLCPGYIAGFGPLSGNRTLVIARYSMGWWPSRICVLLNLVIEVGYGLVNCVVAGLILSAVHGGGMSVIVGIVISALITWVITIFGIRWFHIVERWIAIPAVLVLFVLIGCASPHFNTGSTSKGSGATLAGNRLSYFFLTASGPLGWTPAAADFFVYYPVSTSRPMMCLMTTSGMTLGKLLIEFLGIGLGTGMTTNPQWAAAFSNSGLGALVVSAYSPLQGFGKFCAVILALGIAANTIPATYAAGLNFQQFGGPFVKVPRSIWVTVASAIYTVCAIAGRQHLLSIFLDFLSLIGYWVIIWIAIVLEDEFIFRRKTGFNWEHWEDKSKLPVGVAAFISFLIGWAGAVLCMNQTYFQGPIAGLVGEYGADLGLPVAFAWTAICYPPLRLLEDRILGQRNE